MIDYYKLLGVSRDATDADIKKRYRVLSKKYHPDVGGSQKMMAAINEAMRILSDPFSRADYDADLEAREQKPTPLARAVKTAVPEPPTRKATVWPAIVTSVVIVILAVGWGIVRDNLEHPQDAKPHISREPRG